MPVQRTEKKLIGLIVLLFVSVFSCFGIIAYSVFKQQAVNTFTVGYNKIEIEEDFVPPERLQPGIVIKKEVRIVNSGPTACYVRIMAQYTDSLMKRASSIDINTADWGINGDYYYYKLPLKPGEKTSNLFNKITISEQATQAELSAFDILIYAEAKQAEGESTLKW